MIEWTQALLDDVCLFITDGSHFSPPSVEVGYPMISVKDFSGYGFDFTSCRQISKDDYETLVKNGCMPEIDDILVGKDGARYFEDVIIYKQQERPVLLSSIAIIRANTEKIIPKFLYYFLFNKELRQQVKDNLGSGSAIPRMVLKDFKRIPISYPDIKTQCSIAANLSCLDDKIELNNRIIANLEAQAQAIFKSWFVDFEPFQDGEFEESELGLIPKGWRVVPFTEVVHVLGGGTPKTDDVENWNGNIPFFTPKDAGSVAYTLQTEKTLTEKGLNACNSKLYPENTVFVTARGTVGKIALAGKPMAMNQSCYALVGKNKISQYFVYHLAQNTVERLKGKASGAVFDAIVTRDFDSELIVSPKGEPIVEFAGIVEPLYQQMLCLEKQNMVLRTTRDTLLPKLMSGEIEVPVEG